MAEQPPLFGVVVPGRPAMFDFRPVDSLKAIAFLENPCAVPEIAFFILASTPIPPGHGAILYYSTPPLFVDWVILGSVSLEKPSAIFRTGFPTNELLVGCPAVQLGVALEP